MLPIKDLSNHRIVVPGGAGFVGSHVVEQLVERGATVRVVDNLSRGSLDYLDSVRDSIEWVNADVTELGVAEDLFSGFDCVLNLAGVAPGLTLGEERHAYLERENLAVARAVHGACERVGVDRLLVVSSSCVYPDDAPVPTPELPLDGSLPEQANLGYGLAKRQIEHEALALAKRGQVSVSIIRPFNVFGARDLREGAGAHVIPSLLRRIFSDEPEVVVWGSGRQTRSFIHADDLARAMLWLTFHHDSFVPVNVGSAEEVSMRELIEKLMGLAGVRKPVVFDTSKPEGAPRKAADIAYFRELTGGVHLSMPLDAGLEEIVRAYEKRRHTLGTKSTITA